MQLLEEHNKKLTKLLSRSPRPSTVAETRKTESKNKSIFVFRFVVLVMLDFENAVKSAMNGEERVNVYVKEYFLPIVKNM